MRKFLINVNGNSYEVEVEEIGTATSPSAAPLRQRQNLLLRQSLQHLKRRPQVALLAKRYLPRCRAIFSR